MMKSGHRNKRPRREADFVRQKNMHELHSYLTKIRRRLRLVDGSQLAQRLLWLPLAAALIFQALGRLMPIKHLLWWTLAPIPAWLIAVSAFTLIKPLPIVQIARRVDAQLHLFERISTSLALADWRTAPGAVRPNAFPAELVDAQRKDALIVTRRIDPKRDFPLRWSYAHLRVAGLLILILVISILLPNPMDAVLAQRAAIAQAAQEQATQIEKLRQQVESAPGLSPEDRQEILRQLAELAQKLRDNPGDLEQAMADLSRMEQSLKEQLDPNAKAKAASLQNLASRLETLAGRQPDRTGDAAQAAADALSQLAERLESMTPEERQKLAESLAQMAAQASQAGETELSQALASMASAVQNNDQAAAAQFAQQASQAIAQAQQNGQAQASLQQAVAQLEDSRQALTQAGQSVAQSSAGSSLPASPGSSSSQSQGQASSSGQGSPGGGGGTTSPVLPPNTSQGSARPPQGYKPAGPQDNLSGQVFAPWEHGLSGGNQLFIPGQDTGQGETQASQGEGQLPGSLNPALVPYYQVFYNYLYAANQAMEHSYIPASLAGYIQQYFTQLEP